MPLLLEGIGENIANEQETNYKIRIPFNLVKDGDDNRWYQNKIRKPIFSKKIQVFHKEKYTTDELTMLILSQNV